MKHTTDIEVQTKWKLFYHTCDELLQQESISQEQVNKAFPDPKDAERFLNSLYARSKSFDGADKNKFWKRVENIIPDNIKKLIWEKEIQEVLTAIVNLIHTKTAIPTAQDISEYSKLDLERVEKGLKEIALNPRSPEQMNVRKFYVFAAKLYLECSEPYAEELEKY